MAESLTQQQDVDSDSGGRSPRLIWSLRAFGLAGAAMVWVAPGGAELLFLAASSKSDLFVALRRAAMPPWFLHTLRG
ncbi:hypothetical protein TW86_11510 [Halomonas sp. S2151]|nr:hypothetical protein TW86_11510 [Halomonas sp. S2151]